MKLLDSTRMYYRLAAGLPAFVGRSGGTTDARAAVEARMQQRERSLVNVVERAIYGHPESPYLGLLKEARCSRQDFEELIKKYGVEDTLQKLWQAGVYVTLDEFKGRSELKRNGRTWAFSEDAFDNPYLAHHFEVHSGGTRSAGTRVMVDLDFIESMACDTAVFFDVHRLWNTLQAVWLPVGGTALIVLMTYARLGRVPVKWFSQVDPDALGLSFNYKQGTNFLIRYARILGSHLPWPEVVAVNETTKVAFWLAERSKAKQSCCLTTFASSAVRVCLAAKNENLDLQGINFVTIGEPLTEAKRREILSVGARPIPRYAITEAGIVGYGCGTSSGPDDMHLLRDNLAAIQCERSIRGGNVRVPAFYLTSLLPTSPKILLNVESGDYGVMDNRECQCLFGQLDYTTHLSSVRSYEKFTTEGVTFAGTDLLRIVEEVLPERFGGEVTDYQIVEDDGPGGLPQLFLHISPRVGEINESDVIRTFLQELGKQAEAKRIMSDIWQQASTLKVRRALPSATRAGKVLPFHLAIRNPAM